MQVPFPDRIQYLAEGKKTCRLLAGTFSMSAENQRTLHKGASNQRGFTEYKIRFRWMENGEVKGDFDISTGTMDPRQLTQGNQLVMLVVDVASSTGLVEEYKNFAAKRADGETIPIALWAPDGGQGRFMIEREVFFLDPWAQNKKSNQQFYLLIGGIVLASCIIGIIMPCLIWVLPVSFFGFGMKKFGKKLKGDQVSTSEYFTVAQDWMSGLIANGTIPGVYLRSLGISGGGGSGSGRL